MKILTLSQIRTAERSAVESGAFSFADLMENAGKAFVKILEKKYSPCGKTIVVVCGSGNNGGDGLVIAYGLKQRGANVKIYAPFGLPEGETAKNFHSLVNDIKIIDVLPNECDILIDALFGIGLDRELIGFGADVVEQMNNIKALKIAVDIPSGIDCNGRINTNAFVADETITFIALKPCFVLPKTSEFCGEVSVADIGARVTDYAFDTIEKPTFEKRRKNSHKGTYGKALIIAGSYGMCGAQILSCKAALVTGVGLAKTIVCDKNYAALCTAVPEVVTIPVDTAADGTPDVYDKQLLTALTDADAVLIGCGLGTGEEAYRLVKRTLSFVNVPVIIDADGINCLSQDISIIGKIKAPVILTPHPKEMARLCRTTVDDIEENRIEYARSFANQNGCVVVLKGCNTVVALPDGQIFINTTGNCGLATGGSGDVLSGIIVSRLAQGDSVADAVKRAVWMHGYAADMAAKRMTYAGILPSDIIEELKKIAE